MLFFNECVVKIHNLFIHKKIMHNFFVHKACLLLLGISTGYFFTFRSIYRSHL